MNKRPLISYLKRGWPWGAPLILAFALAARYGLPASGVQTRVWLAVAAAGLAVAYGLLRKRYPDFSLRRAMAAEGPLRRLGMSYYLAVCLTAGLGLMNYFGFDLKNVTTERNYDDVTYYYLNSKYFDELGYTNLYAAMLIADSERDHRFKGIRTFRDLTDYEMLPAGRAFEMKDAIKGRFTAARWNRFCDDLAFIAARWRGGDWHYLFSDHGYNPPPTWTLVGGFLSSVMPVEHLKVITSVDMLLVAGLFAFILWAFGFDAFLFALLFFVTTMSGRWPMVGQALLRFDWLAAAVIGVACYRRERYAAAGAGLAYAGLVRLFPAVLFFPAAVAIGRSLISKRTLERHHLAFLAGAAVMLALLAGGALARYGPRAFVDSAEKMAIHAGPDSYSSQRVGLGDAMIFHGERTRLEMDVRGGTLQKAEELRGRQPYLRAIGLASLIFIAVLMIRTGGPAYRFMPLMVMPFFILTTPQMNYFNLRILLFIWSVHLFKPLRSTVGLVILYLTEALGLHSDIHNVRYFATSITSVCLTAYFAFVVISHAPELFGAGADGGLTWKRVRRPVAILAAALAVLALPHFYYRRLEDDALRTEPVTIEALSKVKAEGTPWNAPGNTVIKGYGISIDLKAVSHASRLSVSLDGNDTYRLELYRDGEPVDLRWTPRRRPGDRTTGLMVHEIRLPAKTARRGVDRVKIIPVEGDNFYSVGHLVFL